MHASKPNDGAGDKKSPLNDDSCAVTTTSSGVTISTGHPVMFVTALDLHQEGATDLDVRRAIEDVEEDPES